LHLGSLAAAVASWLDARSRDGRWLLRIEDLDTPRNVAGAAEQIAHTLARFALRWDGDLALQSARIAGYEAALALLEHRDLLFHCDCSRRLIAAAVAADEPRCVGRCRERKPAAAGSAIRVALDRCRARSVADRGGGSLSFDPATQTDVVVRRRDGVFAYQLAVVVDDAAQGVTDVVRGRDLRSSTSWQLGLQQALDLPAPRYLHIPLVTEPGGAKLAKARRSVPLEPAAASGQLRRSLELLRQQPPASLEGRAPHEVLEWGLEHWDPGAFRDLQSVEA
jgi:glutamyl-Q tRNA(Asp) synthetase